MNYCFLWYFVQVATIKGLLIHGLHKTQTTDIKAFFFRAQLNRVWKRQTLHEISLI